MFFFADNHCHLHPSYHQVYCVFFKRVLNYLRLILLRSYISMPVSGRAVTLLSGLLITFAINIRSYVEVIKVIVIFSIYMFSISSYYTKVYTTSSFFNVCNPVLVGYLLFSKHLLSKFEIFKNALSSHLCIHFHLLHKRHYHYSYKPSLHN